MDLHDTQEQAQAVCDILRRDGLGGGGKHFPEKTWVEPEGPKVPVPLREVEDAGAVDWAWQPFTYGFDYLKDFYDVALPDGTLVTPCYPNAGKMNEMDGERRQFTHEDKVWVRLAAEHPGVHVCAKEEGPDVAAALPEPTQSATAVLDSVEKTAAEEVYKKVLAENKGRTPLRKEYKNGMVFVWLVKDSCKKCQGRGYKGFFERVGDDKGRVQKFAEHEAMAFCSCLRKLVRQVPKAEVVLEPGPTGAQG